MHGHPELKAHCREIQKYLRRYRASYRWIPRTFVIALFGGVLLALATGIVTNSLVLLPIAAIASYLYYRLYRLDRTPYGFIVCLRCDNGLTSIFADWICGFEGCYHKHTYTELPTRRTFLEPCKACNRLPHSLICPDCREPIIFDDGAFQREPNGSAWVASFPPKIAKPAVKEKRPPRHVHKHLR